MVQSSVDKWLHSPTFGSYESSLTAKKLQRRKVDLILGKMGCNIRTDRCNIARRWVIIVILSKERINNYYIMITDRIPVQTNAVLDVPCLTLVVQLNVHHIGLRDVIK